PVDEAGRMEVVRELCSFEGRGPGTDAERRAANRLAARLRGLGRAARIEPFFCHPEYAIVHLIHAALAVAGSLLATVLPAVGFTLVFFAAVSTYLDLNTRFYLARSLVFRRVSQNVVSPGTRPDAPARLVLIAHYDAARTGYIFSRASNRIRRLPERIRLGLGPFRLFFWVGLAPLLPILGARMAGLDATWLSAVQAIPTIVLIVAAFLLIDIALSEIVPGAYDNASGVATVLSAAEELTANPPENLDVWVLLAGSEESFCEGSRAFVRAHRDQLDRPTTSFLNVDSVSHGGVAYEVSQGAVISLNHDAHLIELCEALSSAGAAEASPIRHPLLDDALPPRIHKMRSITIRTTDPDGNLAPWYHTHDDVPERVDGAALTAATDFVVSLARLLDREAGRSQAAAPAEPAPV
ncbi:MAG TPA: M28 family peptidase, partial [Solirubrobacterales bacterium]|nr:M28 family peptidase [Solirubrobacterales bacterium]